MSSPKWQQIETMLAYGFLIGPLDGKIPTTKNGLHDFSADRATIDRWRRQEPWCNWGGRHPELIALDVDPRNGGSLQGLKLDLSKTLTVRTGSGGLHVYYRFSGVARGRLADRPGVDIKKGTTGYCVMPGSLHPDTGNPYRILYSPSSIPPVPQHLLSSIQPPPPSARQVSRDDSDREPKDVGLIETVASAQEGNRNHALFWALMRALEDGMAQATLDAICDAGEGNGLDPVEVRRTYRSARYNVGR